MTLRQDFGEYFSSTAFVNEDGEDKIVGKYGEIVRLEDGTYDCWFVGKDLEPLTEHRLTAIQKKLSRYEKGFHRISGEGWAQGTAKDVTSIFGPLIRVRKRRKYKDPEAAKRRGQKLRESHVQNPN